MDSSVSAKSGSAGAFETPVPSSDSSMGMAGLEPQGMEIWADDAHHAIHTPGGYEWWHFEGIDMAGNGVVVTLFEGLPFHPFYVSNMARWRRQHVGGRFSNPPPEVLPMHYPAVYIGLYQGGKRIAQAINLYPAGSFEGRGDRPEIRVGPNRLTMRNDGSFGLVVKAYPYDIHRGAPRPRRDLVLSANLTFKPSFPGVQHVRSYRPPGLDGANHTWVLAAPHGVMSGRVQLIGPGESAGLVDLPVEALAYHDHNYGQGPLVEDVAWGADLEGPDERAGGIAVKRLAQGHFLGPNYTVVWQRSLLHGLAGTRSDAVLLFEQDHDPIVIEAPTIAVEHLRTTRWLVSYPGRATLHGSDAKGNSIELVIEHTRLMERSPFHVRLEARAGLTLAGRQRYAGVGQTTVLQFQRLRWPLLSDMVLMSLQSIEADDPLWRL